MTYLRKRPRQRRAQATFEAIIEASARILVELGPERLTTNAIATRAGVSVGSLYQYFPNRDAIVRALLERELTRAESLRPALIDEEARPLRERVRAIIDWHFDLHAADPALANSVRSLVQATLPGDEIRRLSRLRTMRVTRTVASLGVAAANVEAAAFIVDTCLDALSDGVTVRRPAWLRSAAFREQVAILVGSYLERAGASLEGRIPVGQGSGRRRRRKQPA